MKKRQVEFKTQLAEMEIVIKSLERAKFDLQKSIGGFEIASIQVNFGTVPADAAERSMRLFGEKVIPRLSDL